MKVLYANHVDHALFEMMRLLNSHGIKKDSRNGEVLELEDPVTTKYKCPKHRVLFSPERDANPFFHLIEALWMLAGRRDVEIPAYYVKGMRKYSDDGVTLHGAYGYRWREHFGFDQLTEVVRRLKKDPNDRQCVISMWDPTPVEEYHHLGANDLLGDWADRPCNTHIYLRVNGHFNKYLDMTVCCRSNDSIFGAAGANSVHFSVLQEYLAARIGVFVGQMYQVSNNLHAYTKVFYKLVEDNKYWDSGYSVPYNTGSVSDTEIVTDPVSFDEELIDFFSLWPDVEGEEGSWRNPVFPEVVFPMVRAYNVFRSNEHSGAAKYEKMLEHIRSGRKGSDWLLAAEEWTIRRYTQLNDKQACDIGDEE